jgi:hypothetical protein
VAYLPRPVIRSPPGWRADPLAVLRLTWRLPSYISIMLNSNVIRLIDGLVKARRFRPILGHGLRFGELVVKQGQPTFRRGCCRRRSEHRRPRRFDVRRGRFGRTARVVRASRAVGQHIWSYREVLYTNLFPFAADGRTTPAAAGHMAINAT